MRNPGEVLSHPRFALARLWDSALASLLWLLGCGLVSALLGGLTTTAVWVWIVLRRYTRKAETDPDAEGKIAALNARRDGLFEKRKRAEDLAIDGDITKERLREVVRAVEGEVEQIAKEIDGLVAPPNIEELYGRREQVLAAWPNWAMGDRRAFLCLLMKRVSVDVWPTDIPRSLPPLKGETAEQYNVRKSARQPELFEKRVTIEWH